MTTNFPSGLDSFTNPTATDAMDSATVPHADQHANVNDAVEALQAKVGVDGSAVTSSLDYQVANQGLTFIKSVTVGSGVSSVTVTDAFSSAFQNYKIMFDSLYCSVNGYNVFMRVGNNGTPYTGTDYWGGGYALLYSGTVNTFPQYGSTQLHVAYTTPTINRTSFSFDVLAPYDTSASTSMMGFSGGYLSGFWWSYLFSPTNRVTDLQFIADVGTFTGGTIRVYGYNNG